MHVAQIEIDNKNVPKCDIDSHLFVILKENVMRQIMKKHGKDAYKQVNDINRVVSKHNPNEERYAYKLNTDKEIDLGKFRLETDEENNKQFLYVETEIPVVIELHKLIS